MRELKFRAWDTGAKRWASGVMPVLTGLSLELKPAHSGIIIEQYTGLKDKNGKEICEGDIVTFMVERFDSITLGFDSEQWHTAVVEWNQDDACYSFVDGDEPFSVQFEAEVIGNIHENGDLLNVD